MLLHVKMKTIDDSNKHRIIFPCYLDLCWAIMCYVDTMVGLSKQATGKCH